MKKFTRTELLGESNMTNHPLQALGKENIFLIIPSLTVAPPLPEPALRSSLQQCAHRRGWLLGHVLSPVSVSALDCSLHLALKNI